MRIIDEKLLRSFKGRACEVCGSTHGTVGHHVYQCSSGRMDLDVNLVALCFTCHTDHHAGRQPSTGRCIELVAARYRVTWERIRTALDQLRALHKWGDPETIIGGLRNAATRSTDRVAGRPGDECPGPVHRPGRRQGAEGVLRPPVVARGGGRLEADPDVWVDL